MNIITDLSLLIYYKKQYLKTYNELLTHHNIKNLNISITHHWIDTNVFIINFKQVIYSTSGDLIIGISVNCCCEPYIIETNLINKYYEQIYDEDLGYVNSCKFININELINHLYNFADGILL